MPEPLPFATALRTARERAGLSQAALAERAGCRQATVSDLERGRTLPDLATALRLCAAIGVQLAVLDGREKIPLRGE